MKTLEKILKYHLLESDSSFSEDGWVDGQHAYNSVVEAMKEYATEYAKEALKNASDKLNRLETETEFGCNEYFVVDDIEEILSESNLPKH